MTKVEYKYLYSINSPADLRKLSIEELPQYCQELRQYIIEQCAINPGHLASSLGAVEIAVAVHYVYDTPSDKLIWDVGHQATLNHMRIKFCHLISRFANHTRTAHKETFIEITHGTKCPVDTQRL